MKWFWTITKWVFLGNGFVSLNQKQNLSDCRKTRPRDWGNLGSLCARSRPSSSPSLHLVGPGGMRQGMTDNVREMNSLTTRQSQKGLWISKARRLSFLQKDRKKRIENMMNLKQLFNLSTLQALRMWGGIRLSPYLQGRKNTSSINNYILYFICTIIKQPSFCKAAVLGVTNICGVPLFFKNSLSLTKAQWRSYYRYYFVFIDGEI